MSTFSREAPPKNYFVRRPSVQHDSCSLSAYITPWSTSFRMSCVRLQPYLFLAAGVYL